MSFVLERSFYGEGCLIFVMASTLSCHCLNVTMHVQGSLPGRSVNVERLRQEVGSDHGFLQGEVMEMDLDFEGVVMVGCSR